MPKSKYIPKANVMDERCIHCGQPPSIRDLIGGEGMTITVDGPVCAREECMLGVDLMDARSPGKMRDVTDQPIFRTNLPESTDTCKQGEFLGHNDRERMDQWMRDRGIMEPENSKKYYFS